MTLSTELLENTIKPHGGELVNRQAVGAQREQLNIKPLEFIRFRINCDWWF